MADYLEWLAPQLSKTSKIDSASDPILSFLRNRSLAVLAGCMVLAAAITVSTWYREDIVPAHSITPKAAIDFVRRANITGNVFNSYNFGGYLIFVGIPTFVDGRALLFGDPFLHKYFDTLDLVDIHSAFEMLDAYKVQWAILLPIDPLGKALARSASWDQVYSDDFSVVFVRRR